MDATGSDVVGCGCSLFANYFFEFFFGIFYIIDPLGFGASNREPMQSASITFWGEVVDGNGNAVSGAMIRGVTFGGENEQLWEVKSSENGRFVLNSYGTRIKILSINHSNMSWYYDRRANAVGEIGVASNISFNFAEGGAYVYHPVFDSPAIFVMLGSVASPSRSGQVLTLS